MMRNSGAAPSYRYAIEKLSFTGEPIDSETADFVEQTFGRPACSMYGTTEIGVILVSYPGAGDFVVKPGSLGKPIPGGRVEVQDAEGRPCAPGVTGELKVWRHGKWIATKDLGRIDEDGYFYHGGRADDVIISAGWTMSAVEIEDAILKHPHVREAAAIGVADALRGQVVKAFVVTDRAGDEAFQHEIQDLVRQRLSQHEYPRVVSFVTELPKTPAGKVNRKVLREREQAITKSEAMKLMEGTVICLIPPRPEFPKITEEGLDDLRQRIGVKIGVTAEPWCYEATRDNIRHYAHGIGDDNPLWCDPDYAAKTNYGGIIALPSFLFAHQPHRLGLCRRACPASTRCGRAPTGPGTRPSAATT